MATPAHTSTYYSPDPDRGAMAKFLAVLFGVGLVIVLAIAFWAVIAAQKARDDAHKAANGAPAATAPASTHDMSASAAAAASPSYAGLAPDNADALATAHKPYPATMPAAPPGAVATVHLTLKDVVHEVAPGIKYSAWAFSAERRGP